MQTFLAITQIVVAIVQVLTLAALVVTAVVAVRQFKIATEQARASEAQAKSSEQMARLSLQQAELMRTQVHAAFRPIIEIAGSEKGTRDAMLTLKNVGTSPALALMAICRSGWRDNLGTLAPEAMRKFRFDNSFNLQPPPPVGPPETRHLFKRDVQAVPLRLEYTSVSGAKCWTNVDFKLGQEGPLEAELEHGIDMPSLNSSFGHSDAPQV